MLVMFAILYGYLTGGTH